MPLGGSLTIGAAAASTLLGGVKSALGFSDIKKAKDEMSQLKDPFYSIQNEFLQNRDIAASEAQGGFSAGELGYLTKENQRGLGSTIGAIEQTGATPNNISEILDGYTRSLENIGFEDAQLHTQNIQKFMDRNKDVGNQKTTQWAQNVLYPYQNKLKQLQERIAAGKQNALGGISDAIGGVSALGTATDNNDLQALMKQFFQPTKTATPTYSQASPNGE